MTTGGDHWVTGDTPWRFSDRPSGDGRWDGVALTLFADPNTLARGATAAAH